jgi:predicted dehydrogenase
MEGKGMDRLRVGVIGLGMGRHHVREFQGHPWADVVAVADLDSERLEAIGEEYAVPHRYVEAEDMLAKEELDIVSVATPNKFHKPLTVAALQAGCHVLCEKPMAMSADEARDMLAAAEEAERRLMINFSYRFTEQSVALKRQVDAGVLGDIYYGRTVWHRRRWNRHMGSWFGQKALSGGGPLIDLGVHRLDLALWLMGYPQPVWVMGAVYDPISAAAPASEGSTDVEDMAVGSIRFANGATLTVEASWNGNISEKELMETRLWGTRGGLVQRNLEETYKFEAQIYVENEGSQFDMALHPMGRDVDSAMVHFVDAIMEDRPHIATGEEGLLVMEILDAIYRSAIQGQPVRIEAKRS